MDDRARAVLDFYAPKHIGTGFHVIDLAHPYAPGHLGQDIRFHQAGTWIPSIADGTIAAVGYNATYGNYISVDIGTVNVYYCHLVNHGGRYAGQKISFGEGVGPLGDTGYSFGPHLHMGVGTGKTPQQRQGLRDPMPYIIAARTTAAADTVTPLPDTGDTPAPPPVREEEEDDMRLLYITDSVDGNNVPGWALLNPKTGRVITLRSDDPANQARANSWAAVWGTARKCTRQDLANAQAAIAATNG